MYLYRLLILTPVSSLGLVNMKSKAESMFAIFMAALYCKSSIKTLIYLNKINTRIFNQYQCCDYS